MSTRYCHPCSLGLGITGGELPSNLTGSVYQVKKFLKHTTPLKSANTTGVFSDPSYTAYAGYLVSSSASGSVEIDDQGRTNIVWYAGKTVGASWVAGKPALPNDSERCARCGNPVLT
jgi:hypothetical protein